MKKMITVIIAVLILATIVPTTAYAKESAMDLYKRDRDAFYKKYMCLDEEAEEQGLYSDANNGAFTKRNKSNKSDSKTSNSSSYAGSGYTGEARGWVYSTDELHVVGLPEGENGYTLSGNYGTIY